MKKTSKKHLPCALPITDAESNAAIVRGLIAGLPPEFAGATKHLREIERRCEVVGRLGKSKASHDGMEKVAGFVQWLEMFAAGFIAEKPAAEKSGDLSLF